MTLPSPFAALDCPRVLIVSLAGIGNLLMASPLFRVLKEANPGATIDVLVAPRGTADVVLGNPRIHHVLLGRPKPSFREWRTLARRLRQARYDVGLVVHPGQRIMSASLLAAGRAHRRIGHRYPWGLFPDTGLFLTDPVPLLSLPSSLTAHQAHDVVQNLRLLAPLGIAVDASLVAYDFPLSAEDHAGADHWRAGRRLRAKNLVGFHPGTHADLSYKRWPAERWSELGDRLSETYGATILVFGGAGERALVAEVCARMERPALPVEVPLRMTAALLVRCLLVVSNDSGLMHVATAQGVPTFGLFGPTDERRTAPWGSNAHVVRASGTLPTYDVANLRAVAAVREPDPTMLALLPETVFREVTAVVPVPA